MKIISISKGEQTLVDDEDYEILNSIKWQCFKRKRYQKIEKYARTTIQVDKKKVSLLMHRVIMGDPIGFLVDHINGNTLDNRKSNLRLVNNSQNLMNSEPRKNCSSKYKGVSFDSNTGKYKAQIQINKKRTHLGLFENELEAAICYNENALKYYGEYARINEL